MKTNQINVEFVAEAFQHRQVGGVSRYVFELLYGLTQNYPVKVHMQLIAHRNQLLHEHARTLNLSSVYCPRITSNWFCRVVPRTDRILRRLRHRKSQLVHSFYYEDNVLNHSSGVKLATFYDMIPEVFAPDGRLAQQKTRCFDQADHCIAISNTTKNEMIRFYGRGEDRISVIPLATNIHSLQARAPAGIDPGTKFLLWVGRRGGYKNFCSFANAFLNIIKRTELSSEYRQLKMICTDEQFNSDDIKQIPEFEKFSERFLVVKVDDQELSWLYRNAVLMGYISTMEGFGLPPLEAMACGCPLITSTAECILEVVGSGGCAVEPFDVEALEDAIVRVIEQKDYRHQLVEYGLERAKHFSWERCVEDTYTLYRKLLSH